MSSERFLHDHHTGTKADLLDVVVCDEAGAGGAQHRYNIQTRGSTPALLQEIEFQEGAVCEAGVNGVTNECLLSIVLDRLRSFQLGSHPCRENAIAITKIEEALHRLHDRTRDRVSRSVEGTEQA